MTARRIQVVLWDIDGTLVSAGGAGRRAFERAVADFVGPFDGALRDMRLDGMTDRLIVREALTILGKPHTDALCDDLLGRYVEHLRGRSTARGSRSFPQPGRRSRRCATRGARSASAPGTWRTARG